MRTCPEAEGFLPNMQNRHTSLKSPVYFVHFPASQVMQQCADMGGVLTDARTADMLSFNAQSEHLC